MRYLVLYKPYGVICQFTPEHPGQLTLGDVFSFPANVYPVGRLDLDSEGLLLLTDDKTLNERLLHPRHKHRRTYWVQVEGEPTAAALQKLVQGVDIRVGKTTHRARALHAGFLYPAPALPERTPPIRFRKNIPTAWLEIELGEGKNRQVRKMCAVAGFPVLRLVRVAIEELRLGNLQPGEVMEYEPTLLRRLLFPH